jgi:hypothetical protein
MHSQRMASIAPIFIGCIDYLAYRVIFLRVRCFVRKKTSARKVVDERWEVVVRTYHSMVLSKYHTIECIIEYVHKDIFLFLDVQLCVSS